MDIKNIQIAAKFISERIGGQEPVAGIILGSGLGKLADMINDSIVIPYNEIPGFPVSTAIGHKGNLIFGTLGDRKVVAMQGRFHYYEGYPMDLVTLPIRVMSMLGCEYLFVSNAAGGCGDGLEIGDIVIIKDHINFLPNPLIGPNMEEFGTRFPDMTCVYDRELQAIAEGLLNDMGIPVKYGVYLASTGPTYETPAEVRFFKTIGADLLGMSTIPEVIVARHCGMRVFGVSIVTNISNTTNEHTVLNDSEDVVRQADLAAEKMTALFSGIIQASLL